MADGAELKGHLGYFVLTVLKNQQEAETLVSCFCLYDALQAKCCFTGTNLGNLTT